MTRTTTTSTLMKEILFRTVGLLLSCCLLLLLAVWDINNNVVLVQAASSALSPPPLKVFLMVGQSNMQGHGYISGKDDTGNNLNGTLDWMVDTYPEKYGKLKNASTSSNGWTRLDDVWIAYNRQESDDTRSEMHQFGSLTVGYGGDPERRPLDQQGHYEIGPELGFGWTIHDAFASASEANQQQTLLIKIAWGGRNLSVDFRPPSSAASSGGETGLYYTSMIDNTYKTLSELEKYFPQYNSSSSSSPQSYELAGFIWHQGWNDGCDINMTASYETNLANLIRDVRKDLATPNLPVAIGVSGMEGWNNPSSSPHDKTHRRQHIIDAQFAVAKYPEFAGTVTAVETRNFVRSPYPNGSPGTEGYHWNNNCESYWLVGEAMAQGILKLINHDADNNQQQG